jgi:ABC-type tungstate transport system substrate-binding protein
MPDNTTAFHLLLTGDPVLFSIVGLSLAVSLTASVVASFIGMPLGALVALTRFRGREFVIVGMNALMGLPPVIVGLAVYLSLSRSGPLGSWGIAQTIAAILRLAESSDPYRIHVAIRKTRQDDAAVVVELATNQEAGSLNLFRSVVRPQQWPWSTPGCAAMPRDYRGQG